MLGYVLLGPDDETVQRLTEQPLVRALCVLLPAAVFRELGVEPPLPEHGRRRRLGLPRLHPDRGGAGGGPADRGRHPARGGRHYAFCGTPEQVAAQIREYAAAGLRHLVMWNITAFGDPDLARYSFAALKELRAELAR